MANRFGNAPKPGDLLANLGRSLGHSAAMRRILRYGYLKDSLVVN